VQETVPGFVAVVHVVKCTTDKGVGVGAGDGVEVGLGVGVGDGVDEAVGGGGPVVGAATVVKVNTFDCIPLELTETAAVPAAEI